MEITLTLKSPVLLLWPPPPSLHQMNHLIPLYCCLPKRRKTFGPMVVLVDVPLDENNDNNNGERGWCIGWNKMNDTAKSHNFRNLDYKFLKFGALKTFELKLQNSVLLAWRPQSFCQKISIQSLFSKF